MLNFECDYMKGACPAVLQRLIETNMDETLGYGADPYCRSAIERIRAACGCPEARVYFLTGGTQVNATAMYAVLRHCQGVISPVTGHINHHESGAVEATGHKVIALPGHDGGKLKAEDVERYLKDYWADENYAHIVEPGMVYITHPTELGALYTMDELNALSSVCRRYRIPLYLDGARLAYALASDKTDITLEDIASLCDIFYIGGTKCGALFGEALVVPRPKLTGELFSIIKQRGAMLAAAGSTVRYPVHRRALRPERSERHRDSRLARQRDQGQRLQFPDTASDQPAVCHHGERQDRGTAQGGLLLHVGACGR